jgi:hypothetical protein
VELLNRNKVDISSLPLDSYSDGEDMEEDGDDEEGGEDGDDELEEIEEEVFDLSQPPRRRRGRQTTPRSKTLAWCGHGLV